MRDRRGIGAAGGARAAKARPCGGSGTENQAGNPGKAAAAPADDDTKASAGSSVSGASDSDSGAITVPDYKGHNLQEAQDAAQSKGIHLLKSRDLSVRQRMQVWDRNWQVCDQEPAAGSVMRDTGTLTFAVVKTEESCDAPDATAGSASGDGRSEPTGEPTDAGSSTTAGGSGSDESGSFSGGGSAEESGSGSTSDSGEPQQAPAGASAQCSDGSYSYSRHRRGTCSHHHGVAVWLRSLPA
ncbi:DUF3761 domain-containing protein [Streptomyces auratus]|uniref:PASTA domain-containing protein n=2 Tax=Streptomyces auratus AGR0001 TaxID=1160718 RepID=J1RXV5_9ACTN|nr:DUF3761 domain-containing protein [Streptomyces auratus]